ncbi:hypothetical protein [Apibacter adventoris]|uniref:hypothetical protein n=1 Tax=Apibacter adventoris TaxID=1679466 RepID=UPI000CF60402|nr:hypothetical protein [Apibacter adventoris]PQL94398.1 hypothetical protein C4S76_05880 [Apibacter adventoris]
MNKIYIIGIISIIVFLSCKPKKININLNQIGNNSFIYTFSNNSENNIKLILPQTKYICWKDEKSYNYPLGPRIFLHIYNSSNQKVVKNVYINFHENTDENEKYNSKLEYRNITLKSGTIYYDTLCFPLLKEYCYSYYQLEKNKSYYLQLELYDTAKDSLIGLSNKIKCLF